MFMRSRREAMATISERRMKKVAKANGVGLCLAEPNM